jgi:uncharacterized protein YwgA
MDTTHSSLVLNAMQLLSNEGSWCGETHIQKTIYLCQTVLGAPAEFKFVLYKHGPYSFQLSDHLQKLISDSLVRVLPQPPPYGPSLRVTEDAVKITAKSKINDALLQRIGTLSKKLSSKTVSDLEKLATAVYVKRNFDQAASPEKRAAKMHELKSHVSVEAALIAIREADIIEIDLAA